MPNILIDARAIADCKSGGINRVARLWIIEQTKSYSPQNCHCITTGLKPSEEVRRFCDQNDFNYIHLTIPNKIWTFFCRLNLASLILSAEHKLKQPVDLLLLPNIAYTGALYRPYHILVHDLSFIIEPKWFSFKRRLWHKYIDAPRRIANADEIHCVSNQTKSDVKRLLSIDDAKCHIFHFDPKLEVRSPGFEVRSEIRNTPAPRSFSEGGKYEIRPSWLPSTAKRFILLLGGSDPRKNIIVALKAIAEFNIRHPQKYLTPLVLGGKVNFPAGHKIACVQAPGFIKDDVLYWLYQNAAALLYPSWYEGFGLPLHEAHQFNTPVIASTAGALPETAPPNTIFCHPAKIHEWIQTLELIEL
ncbi:MAG: glycosyltransferase [Patescibacteria group bacterium]